MSRVLVLLAFTGSSFGYLVFLLDTWVSLAYFFGSTTETQPGEAGILNCGFQTQDIKYKTYYHFACNIFSKGLNLVSADYSTKGFADMWVNLADFLRNNRSVIIREWVRRLYIEAGEQYAQRPSEELFGTVSEAFDANYHVLVHDDFSHINQFIDNITNMRLGAGFLLSDVQKAFELYRTVVFPLLVKQSEIEGFFENTTNIDKCLAYTIHRFSDHFQKIHQNKIMEHNRRLEQEVMARTAELRESELKYKTLVEEITDGYFVIQGRVIVFANQAFCRMHGYTLGEVLGKGLEVFVAPESREKVIGIYNKRLGKRSVPRTFEFMRLTKQDDQLPTEILANNIWYENRLSSIGICRDITERTKMEQKVREAEKMAYIGQIATSLSHEIRNPLSAVKMNLQILTKNPELRGNDQRRIDISVREVIRLERILKELLDYAKPLQVKFGNAHINPILSSCIEVLEIKFKEKNLSILSSLEAGIPELRADGEKLEQAFINLLLNAIEASHQDGEVLVNSLHHPDGAASWAEIVISDEGNGVPEKDLNNIFKPFFTTRSKGTGLGLSNAKRIVEAHGGRLEVENLQPCGSCFRMHLPIGKDHGQDSYHR